jgi:hypothetical protein
MKKTFIILVALLSLSTLYAQDCTYEKIFGFAKIKKIEKELVFLSFSVENRSGKRVIYKETLKMPFQWGLKIGEVYPAMLDVLQTGECDKYKLMVIQEIGAACKVK